MAINPETGLEYTPEELALETAVSQAYGQDSIARQIKPEQVQSLMDVAMYAPKPYAMTIKTPKTAGGIIAKGIQAFQEGAYGVQQQQTADDTNAMKQEQLRLAAIPRESVNKKFQESAQEDKLRKEFNSKAVVKSFNEVNVKYEQLRNLLNDASVTSDMGAIFNLMKTLDPTSVVRESEYMVAKGAGSLWEKLKSIVGEATGDGRLTDMQREEFARTADALYKAWNGAYKSEVEDYTILAKHKGISPEYVIKNFSAAMSIFEELSKNRKAKTEVEPATGIEEGIEQKSKLTGKVKVFKNGKWEYKQ